MLVLLCIPSLSCSTEDAARGGAGGSGAMGGTGGGGTGGEGGAGGVDGQVCRNASDCDDGEPCTNETCTDQFCVRESLPDNEVCFNGTSLSICLSGVCQIIWASCAEPEANDGDFCQPSIPVPRIGRCVAVDCEVLPCEVAFDCWDGDLCTSDVCEQASGECSHPDAPDGTRCGIAVPMECLDGECVSPQL